VLTRLTTVGGLYLVAVCLPPEVLISDYGLPFYFGGTSILTVVSVTWTPSRRSSRNRWHQ
jgi:preprotein translocase subunit SecY